MELKTARTLHENQLNESKCQIEKFKFDNENLRKEIAHIKSVNVTLSNEERNKFEQEINQLTEDNEQYKKKYNERQVLSVFFFLGFIIFANV